MLLLAFGDLLFEHLQMMLKDSFGRTGIAVLLQQPGDLLERNTGHTARLAGRSGPGRRIGADRRVGGSLPFWARIDELPVGIDGLLRCHSFSRHQPGQDLRFFPRLEVLPEHRQVRREMPGHTVRRIHVV